jgi:hypothetical protein
VRRRNWALTALALSLIFFASLANPAQAASLNITDIPRNLGIQLGAGTFAGGLIASAILILALVLPTALIARKKNTGFVPELVMGFLGLCICVGIGWLSYWILLVIALLVAVMFAGTMRKWITGE